MTIANETGKANTEYQQLTYFACRTFATSKVCN